MASSILKKGMSNIKYVLASQAVSYAVSFLTSFVLPGVLGVVPNGYYQVYVFYLSYIGILHFGFNDGVYLKYGSFDYDELPRPLFRSFIRFYGMMTGCEILICLLVMMGETDPNKRFAFFFVTLDILVVNLSSLFNYINQITDRVRLYSFAVVAEKIQIVAAVLVLIALHRVDFRLVIVCDFAAKLVVLGVNLWNDRAIVFGPHLPMRQALPECIDNISTGMKLMIANFMGMLVMGLGRFMLERFGSVRDFSLYSFAVSSINIAMMFVSSVSLILYPMLCRLDRRALPGYFQMLSRMLSAVIFCMMLLYFPLVPVIRLLLGKYAAVLDYLYLLFPIVIMQSKITLLINTYYKSLRREGAMMLANLSSVGMFLLLAGPAFYFYPSVKVIVWATLITFTWRCYASEIYLKRQMKITDYRGMWEELTMAAAFMLAAGLLPGIWGFLAYAACTLLYLFCNRRVLLDDVRRLRATFRS